MVSQPTPSIHVFGKKDAARKYADKKNKTARVWYYRVELYRGGEGWMVRATRK